jgi:hypothetical protein
LPFHCGEVTRLADDLLEGRGPGTRGGELAANHIATQFALLGLKPAGDEGSYLQNDVKQGPAAGRPMQNLAKLS